MAGKGKPRRRQQALSSRERIIQAASQLFEIRGYDGTGLNEIIRRASAPRGSIYYHFPKGKEQIAEEVVLRAGESLAANVLSMLGGASTVAGSVRSSIDALSGSGIAPGYRSGGALTILALETAATHARLNKACRAAYGRVTRAVGERLRSLGVAEGDALALSTLIAAAVEGGIVLCRTLHSRRPMNELTAVLARMVADVKRAPVQQERRAEGGLG